jgi:ricin-type beta-trefoil lectin protein
MKELTMFKKMAMATMLAMATVAGVLGVTASSASASYASGIVVTGVQSTLAMEVRSWSRTPGMTIDQQRSNADSSSHSYYGTSQQWSLPTNSSGGWDGATGVIWNMYSGLCIETDGHAGDAVYQWTCNGSVYQQWSISTFSVWDWGLWLYVTHTHIVNPATGLALDVRGGSMSPGAAIVGWPLNGNNSDNQAWDLNPA